MKEWKFCSNKYSILSLDLSQIALTNANPIPEEFTLSVDLFGQETSVEVELSQIEKA